MGAMGDALAKQEENNLFAQKPVVEEQINLFPSVSLIAPISLLGGDDSNDKA